MTSTYRFPLPREERLLILIGALLTGAVWVSLFVTLAGLARSLDLSLSGLFARSTELRALIAAMVVVLVASGYAAWAYAAVRAGTRLVVDDETARLLRPGVPIFGWGARDVTLKLADVDSAGVASVTVRLQPRRRLTLTAARAELVCDLNLCVPDGGPTTPAGGEPHPVLVALRARLRPAIAAQLGGAPASPPHSGVEPAPPPR